MSKSIKRKEQFWRMGMALLVAVLIFLSILVVFFPNGFQSRSVDDVREVDMQIVNRTLRNYGHQSLILAEKHELSAEYLLALVALEASGRKLVPPRFERHIYRKLLEVKEGKREAYENVKTEHLLIATTDDLRDMAKSWGPLQLMGYKAVDLSVPIDDFREDNIFALSVAWVNLEYGYLIKNGDFKDAFHYHNTGKKYPLLGPPKTFRKDYVQRGLNYMAVFKEKLNSTNWMQ